MKNLVVVILCFFCMITFHEAVSRDAPAKETAKHYPPYPRTNPSRWFLQMNNISDTISPDLVDKPSYQGNMWALPYSIHESLYNSWVYDSVLSVRVIMTYEVDTLGVFALQWLRVTSGPPKNNPDIRNMVAHLLDSMKYDWIPGTINGKPVPMKDSIWFSLDFKIRKKEE